MSAVSAVPKSARPLPAWGHRPQEREAPQKSAESARHSAGQLRLVGGESRFQRWTQLAMPQPGPLPQANAEMPFGAETTQT